jgi:parvulin-like peptidyl-prolyl isomerase
MRGHFVLAGVIALGLVALGLPVLVGCGGKQPPADVVARVDGQAITRDEVCKFVEQQEGGSLAARALDALISRQLIRQKAKERGLKVTEEEIKARIASMKDDALASTGKSWEQMLGESGQTEADLRDQVSADLLVGKLLIPDSERKAWFEQNQEKLKDYFPHNNESVIYRRIVVAEKAEAEAIRKELTTNKAADFAKLAEQKSIDPMTRDRGGMAGWAVKGKLSPGQQDLEKVLFTLKPGEISQPLPFKPETSQAQSPAPAQWQLVLVVRYIAPHPLIQKDNERQIEQLMVRTDPRLSQQAGQFIDDLLLKAKVEIVNPRYKLLEKEYARRREAAQQMVPMGGGPMMPPGPAPSQVAPVAPKPPAGQQAPIKK